MDNLTQTKEEIKESEADFKDGEPKAGERKKTGIFGSLGMLSAESAYPRDKRALLFDLCIFLAALFLARCHVVFSSHPLGLAFIAVLPVGVPVATLGAAIGSLTLGQGGVIYAVASLIVAFIRVIISGADRGEERGELFSENILLRMSSSVLGGFVAAVYEVLLSGLAEASLLYGLSMILLPPVLTFAFSGIFTSGITAGELIAGHGKTFSLRGRTDKEKFNLVFFQGSALVFLFFMASALAELDLFGISVSYIFVSLVTLFVAKRFGALRALAVGFFSSLGISGVFAVSFALAGLGSGILFGFGTAYALIGGGAALSAWGAYSAGLTGFLSTLPEYMIAATLSVPLLKRVSIERTEEESESISRLAEDMVGTTALSYRNRYNKNLDSLEAALDSLGGIMREHKDSSDRISDGEYADMVVKIAEDYCAVCRERELCQREGISPCAKNAERLALQLSKREKITPENINTDTEFCQAAEALAEELNRRIADAETENYRQSQRDSTAEDYELISRLIGEARGRDAAERSMDAHLSRQLGEILEGHGFTDGSVRVFGEREKHFILAGEDEGGERITSPELRREIESLSGVRLGTPEYFRRDKMVLMECDARPAYSVEFATVGMTARSEGVSGDTATAFTTRENHFYSVLSDGMGSGELARDTSRFVVNYLEKILGCGASADTVMYMLNHALRRQRGECSASVDLFEFDLYSGDATFIKSGAAASYVKRDSSIFRIRSQTAPIGLMRTIDTEKIRVEIRPEDYVVMLSDGISPTDDSPWLLEALTKPSKKSPKEYAEYILSLARENTKGYDDMTVTVLRISGVA